MSNVYVPIVDDCKDRPTTYDFTIDSEYLRGIGKEFSERFLQNVEYIPIDFTNSNPTNIYGEQDFDGTVFFEPIRVRANAEINPSQRRLEKWGIKEHRDIVFFIAIKVLEEKNLSTTVGDQIKYEDIFYKVTETQVDKREWGSLRPLTVRLLCNRLPIEEAALES